MLYHDSVVNELVKIFTTETATKNAAFVFLSDHGEELYENRDHAGHGFPPTKVTSEIPYFTILSEQFKNNYPQLERNMRARLNTPYSSVNNFFTTLQMLNIQSKKYQPNFSANAFFSATYDSIKPRIVMGMDYDKLENNSTSVHKTNSHFASSGLILTFTYAKNKHVRHYNISQFP